MLLKKNHSEPSDLSEDDFARALYIESVFRDPMGCRRHSWGVNKHRMGASTGDEVGLL